MSQYGNTSILGHFALYIIYYMYTRVCVLLYFKNLNNQI